MKLTLPQGFERALDQSLDAVTAKAKWTERDRGDVEGWLGKHGLFDKVNSRSDGKL